MLDSEFRGEKSVKPFWDDFIFKLFNFDVLVVLTKVIAVVEPTFWIKEQNEVIIRFLNYYLQIICLRGNSDEVLVNISF